MIKKMTISITHFYDNKEVQHIIVSVSKKEIPTKDIKLMILEYLQRKKESWVEYNNYKFWIENEYVYPNKETEYKYFELPEYKTGKKIINIVDKNTLKKFSIEKNTWLNVDQLFQEVSV